MKKRINLTKSNGEVTRRDFLRFSAAGLMVGMAGNLLSACGTQPAATPASTQEAASAPTAAPAAAEEEKILNVLAFSGYEEPGMLDAFFMLPATEARVLVSAAEEPEISFLQNVKSHLGCVVVSRVRVPRFAPQSLPALEPERGRPQFHGPAMDKEHPVLSQLHGHGIEDREKR